MPEPTQPKTSNTYVVTVAATWVKNGDKHRIECPQKFFSKAVSDVQAANRVRFRLTHKKALPPHNPKELKEWEAEKKVLKSFMEGISTDLQQVGLICNFEFKAKLVEPTTFPKPLPPKPEPQMKLPLKEPPKPKSPEQMKFWSGWYGKYIKKQALTYKAEK